MHPENVRSDNVSTNIMARGVMIVRDTLVIVSHHMCVDIYTNNQN